MSDDARSSGYAQRINPQPERKMDPERPFKKLRPVDGREAAFERANRALNELRASGVERFDVIEHEVVRGIILAGIGCLR